MTAIIVSPGSDVAVAATAWQACSTLPALAVNPYPPENLGGGIWRLTAPGVYCWRDAANLEHLLIVKPESRANCVRLIWEIVCASVDGGSAETNAYYQTPAAQAAFALLETPRVRSWNCGPAAAASMNLLAAMGVYTRMVQWIGPTANKQHQNYEAQTEAGWTLADPHYGLLYKDGFGAVDLWESARNAQPLAPKLAAFRNEASWTSDPWTILGAYDMAMFPRIGGIKVWPCVATVTEAVVEAAVGDTTAHVLPVTPAEMREAFY
jgi:hypothetical protein